MHARSICDEQRTKQRIIKKGVQDERDAARDRERYESVIIANQKSLKKGSEVIGVTSPGLEDPVWQGKADAQFRYGGQVRATSAKFKHFFDYDELDAGSEGTNLPDVAGGDSKSSSHDNMAAVRKDWKRGEKRNRVSSLRRPSEDQRQTQDA